MRKLCLFTAAVLCSIAASAQVFEVTSMQQLSSSTGVDTKVAGVSPTGDYVLLTTGSNNGLQCLNLSTQELTTLSTAAGAGYNVQISPSGQEVVFRETVVGKDNLRRNNIVRQNLTNKRRTQVARNQRDLQKMTATPVSVTVNDRLLVLNQDGKTTTLAPNGTDKSYIWPSLSPDGTKLCYYVCGEGCYVSQIDGTNPQYIAHDCRAAKWYDNNTIVAMADEDDGHFTTASAIVAYTLDGRKQVLTDHSMIAMYPFAARNCIVFATLDGNVYMLNIK